LENAARELFANNPEILTEFLNTFNQPNNAIKSEEENHNSESEHSHKNSIQSNEEHKVITKIEPPKVFFNLHIG